MLLISEIFYSIQGEGELVGTPSTFIRLSGCNRNCSWCDTHQREHVTLNILPEDLAITIQTKNIVITGGEPMLQIKDLLDFIMVAHYNKSHITIETNGDIFPSDKYMCIAEEALPDLFSVSPKFTNIELFTETIEKWDNSDFNVVFKFVVETEEELDLILSRGFIKPVIIQPCEPEKKIVPILMKRLHELEKRDIRVIPQTHKYLKVL